MTKREKKALKLLFSAYTFVNVSRDGMDISRAVNIKPYDLYKMTKKNSWRCALGMNGYYGKNIYPTGDGYREALESEFIEKVKVAAREWYDRLYDVEIPSDIARMLDSTLHEDHVSDD